MPVKVPSRSRVKARSTSQQEPTRIVVENVNVPGYTTTVDAAKYTAMRRALLKVLPARAPGLTQAEMVTRVVSHLPPALFPAGAKAAWWAKCVQLDLEAKRVIAREPTKPIRWHRRAGN